MDNNNYKSSIKTSRIVFSIDILPILLLNKITSSLIRYFAKTQSKRPIQKGL